MHSRHPRATTIVVALASLGILLMTAKPAAAQKISEQEAYDIGVEAYVYFYPLISDVETHEASELAVSTLYSWPLFQWAETHARTGKSKVFYYYFEHTPPAPANERYTENLGKDLGVYHGAEIAYAFENFVPREFAWTDADRALAETVSQYWVNFATNGDPNGPGLPPWPAFNPETASVQHFNSTIAAGPIPNQKYYAFWDKVLAGWKGR